ncbi:S16 family serine protease, partial [Clostridium paraputrificum]|uniref:S16 family serine protease n=3 Tax=Clostridiaceae TaxID=31979 RepID=UPI003119A6EB
LLDRMEVIEVSGYTYEEKFNIAKEHLIPKIFNDLDIPMDNIKIEDESIRVVVEGYTRESGVRGLERKLTSLVRKVLADMIKEGKKDYVVKTSSIEELLGKRIFNIDEVDKFDKVGVVNGMAWTAYGG